MFRNVLAATLRNLMRNGLYAAISIGGLAIGMAAVILTGLYVRDEASFDRFIPGHDKVYVGIFELGLPGRPLIVEDWTPYQLAKQLKLGFNEVQAAGRLYLNDDPVGVRRGDVEGLDAVGWADADLFRILHAPVLAGDPAATLDRPDGAVITRAMARKYFGQDAPIGQVLEINRSTRLRVGAVLYDLPSTSELTFRIYGSNANAASPVSVMDKGPPSPGVAVRTYLRLDGGAAAAARINPGLPEFFRRLTGGRPLPKGVTTAMRIIPLTDLHFYPLRGTTLINVAPRGDPSALVALSAIAGLILALACINFVNLMTGRAARRAVEVGVRKASGAGRRHLVLQFIGEAVVYAFLALLLALAIAELVLPLLRAFVDRPLALDYRSDLGLWAILIALAAGVGVLTGVYPALVLSSFRPGTVLKGALPQTAGSAVVRSGLTTLQFAVLTGLVLAVMVIGLQTRYAMNQGLNLDKAQVLTLDVSPQRGGSALAGPARRASLCYGAFIDRVRAIPGVMGAACSGSGALDMGDSSWNVQTSTGTIGMNEAVLDPGFLELYGLKPLAGRFFSTAHPEDETAAPGPAKPRTVVINESAARRLGFASPQQAIGQSLRVPDFGFTVQVVGVVRDFAFDLTKGQVRPSVYWQGAFYSDTLNIKLNGADTAGVLRAIGEAWKTTGVPHPPRLRFVDDYLQSLYAAIIRQGRLLDGLCVVAVLLAGLGLFGLASFTAERRIKEIGVRKAMGASSQDVARLLLWSFSQPVLWANVIAWPLAWWTLHRWLEGFARHIALEPWMFVAAALAALAVAIATVLAHTLRVARAKPVGALRYE